MEIILRQFRLANEACISATSCVSPPTANKTYKRRNDLNGPPITKYSLSLFSQYLYLNHIEKVSTRKWYTL